MGGGKLFLLNDPQPGKKLAFKKKPKSKKSNTNAKYPMVRSMGQAFPDIMKIKLRYNAQIGVTSTSGVMTSHIMRINSIYDPDLTYTGHQPLGADNCFGLYDQVLVTGVKYTIRANSSVGLQQFVVYPLSDSTPPTDITTAREFPRSQNRLLNPYKQTTIKGYHSVKKLRGLTTLTTTDEDYVHTSSAGPTIKEYLVMSAQSIDGSSTTTSYITATFDYYCMFFARKKLSQN